MTDSEVTALGPEFEKDWQRDFVPFPTRPVMLCGVVDAFLGDHSTLSEQGQYMTLGVYTAYPYSRGSIHITSKDDVLNGYEFDAGFFNHDSDIKKQLWAYKMSREIARRLPYYRGELDIGHPKFAPESDAAIRDVKGVAPDGEVANIQYSAEDDEIIQDWIRSNVNTTWHSLGTCAMRSREKGGVVDQDLNVYGVQGLKVGDLSIVPENVGANTNNTALAIGEKLAMIVERELFGE